MRWKEGLAAITLIGSIACGSRTAYVNPITPPRNEINEIVTTVLERKGITPKNTNKPRRNRFLLTPQTQHIFQEYHGLDDFSRTIYLVEALAEEQTKTDSLQTANKQLQETLQTPLIREVPVYKEILREPNIPENTLLIRRGETYYTLPEITLVCNEETNKCIRPEEIR